MLNAENIQKIVSWSSTKNENGTYTAIVYSFDHEVKSVIHAEYTRPTRARAVAAAKKTVRYLKAQK